MHAKGLLAVHVTIFWLAIREGGGSTQTGLDSWTGLIDQSVYTAYRYIRVLAQELATS